MSHSLVGADRRTHCKIVALAVAGAVSLSMLAGATWRPESEVAPTRARERVPLPGKVIHLFVDMDKMVGPDFESGLASLKAAAEKSSTPTG
jgi:hypothetical protein